MSPSTRRGLPYALVAAVAVVAGLLMDSGLLVLVGALVVVLGFLHVTRGRSQDIEEQRAQGEASVREGRAGPESHGGW